MFITIKGKEYKVKFTFNALADMEAKAGKGIAEILKEDAIGFTTIRLLLWSCLKKELGNITLEEAGELAQDLVDDGKTFGDLAEIFIKALMESGLLGDAKKK